MFIPIETPTTLYISNPLQCAHCARADIKYALVGHGSANGSVHIIQVALTGHTCRGCGSGDLVPLGEKIDARNLDLSTFSEKEYDVALMRSAHQSGINATANADEYTYKYKVLMLMAMGQHGEASTLCNDRGLNYNALFQQSRHSLWADA